MIGVVAIASDAILHRYQLVWVGRYLGIVGTIAILISLRYSLRKRKIISSGDPKRLLRVHEALAWFGSLLVLMHAGIHFNALLPWLAIIAMGINVMSGMVGKFLLARARTFVQGKREALQASSQTAADIEKALFWDALSVSAMSQWRKVHIPIFILFAILALSHIISILLFWGWV
jgi:hypothetical protein